MRSTINLLIVISLLAFTLACGLAGDQESGGTDSATNGSESGSQEALEDSDLAEDGEDEEAAADEDASGQGEDKLVAVKFAKGSTTRSYSDVVDGGFKHVYKFGVTEDQTINVRIASMDDKATFKVFDPSGAPVSVSGAKTNFSEPVSRSGEYRIEVTTSGDRSEYTVRFGASALPADDENVPLGGLTKTVRFAKGKSSASYDGAVIRGESDVYELGASGGQQMTVSITSLEDNAVFQVEGPGGYLRGAEPGSDRTSWSGPLPANGKYRVIVGGTRGNATYKITISIR